MGVQDFTLKVKRPRGVDNTLSSITQCTNAVLKNTSDDELYLRIVRVKYLQSKTYKFLPGQIRDDIISEDYISGRAEIERLVTLGKLQVIAIPDCTGKLLGGGGGACRVFNFDLTDWVSTDAGDTYSVDLVHNLDSEFVSVTLYEGSTQVWAHEVFVLTKDIVRIKVTQFAEDCRFIGTALINLCA